MWFSRVGAHVFFDLGAKASISRRHSARPQHRQTAGGASALGNACSGQGGRKPKDAAALIGGDLRIWLNWRSGPKKFKTETAKSGGAFWTRGYADPVRRIATVW